MANKLIDGLFSNWTTNFELTDWLEYGLNLQFQDAVNFVSAPFSCRLIGDTIQGDSGNIESRPGIRGGPYGPLYFQLTAGVRYDVAISGHCHAAGPDQVLAWSIHLYNNATDAPNATAFMLNNDGSDAPGVFVPGVQASGTWPFYTVPGDAAWHSFGLTTFLVAGAGVAGTYWASVHFAKRAIENRSIEIDNAFLDDTPIAPPTPGGGGGAAAAGGAAGLSILLTG